MQNIEAAKDILFGIDVNRAFELGAVDSYIGRSRDNEIPMMGDLCLSRRHAVITRVNGSYYLRDLRSSNGTVVNGTKVQGCVMLNPGDEIFLGRSMFLFCPSQEKLAEIALKKEESITVNQTNWRSESLWDKITRRVLLIFRPGSVDTIQDKISSKPASPGSQLAKASQR